LFALSSEPMQHETVGLLSRHGIAETVDQLMRSNRMDPAETDYLLQVLAAVRSDSPIPAVPEHRAVSDRGNEFAAAAALSVLLPQLDSEARAGLVEATMGRLNGSLPSWIKGTMYGEMLLNLGDEARTDLLLEVNVDALAAWLEVQTPSSKVRILDAAPNALRAALSATPVPSSPDDLHALANGGGSSLSVGLLRCLQGGDVTFQTLLV
jgi:hypothetical protein